MFEVERGPDHVLPYPEYCPDRPDRAPERESLPSQSRRRTQADKPLRAGIIGLDTSHVTAFTQRAERPQGDGRAGRHPGRGGAIPAGSPDIPSSRDRVAGYTKELRDKYGVEIVDSIDELLKKVDVVLLESVDGRPHLAQARPVFQAQEAGLHRQAGRRHAGRRDRDLRAGQGDGHALLLQLVAAVQPGDRGDEGATPRSARSLGCDAYGPCHLEEHHPDLYWYGVHGVETLFTIMGTGCESVSRVQTEGTDLVGGRLEGRPDRHLPRPSPGRRATTGRRSSARRASPPAAATAAIEPLVVEICKFFRTGKPPVAAEETIEIFAFMEAADESKRQGGKPVTIESVMAKAKAELAGRGLEVTAESSFSGRPSADLSE